MNVQRYAAFISYRHLEQDRKWAKWVLQAIETYRVSKDLVKQGFPKRLGKCFRDEDEIPASNNLTDQIMQALKASDYLIVICSKNTPESQWVAREIELFREMGKGDKILALLIDGEPSQSFPEALRFDQNGIEVEPLAADVRPRADLNDKQLKELARLRLSAALLGCKYDDLKQREKARARRKHWQMMAGAISLCLVLVGFWQTSQFQINNTNEEALVATIQSKGQQLAVTASKITDMNLAGALLVEAKNYYPKIQIDTESIDINARALLSQSRAFKMPTTLKPIYHKAGPDRSFLVIIGSIGYSMLDLKTGKWLYNKREIRKTFDDYLVEFSERGDVFAVGETDGTLIGYHSKTGEQIFKADAAYGTLYDIAFIPGAKKLGASYADGTVRIFDMSSSEPITSFKSNSGHALSIDLSSDGIFLACGYSNGDVIVWDTDTLEKVSEIKSSDKPIFQVGFEPEAGDLFTSTSNGEIKIWDPLSGAMLHTLSGHSLAVDDWYFLEDNNRLITTSFDGSVRVWDIFEGQQLSAIETSENEIITTDLSSDQTEVLSIHMDGTAKIWDVETGSLKSEIYDSGVNLQADDIHDFSDVPNAMLGGFYSGTGANVFVVSLGHIQTLISQPIKITHNVTQPKKIRTIEFSKNGRKLLSGDENLNFGLWNSVTGEPEKVFDYLDYVPDGSERLDDSTTDSLYEYKHQISATFTANEEQIIMSVANQPLIIWDAEWEHGVDSDREYANVVLISPNKKYVLQAADDSLGLYNQEDFQLGEPFTVVDEATGPFVFSPDSSKVFFEYDGTPVIWGLEEGELITTFDDDYGWLLTAAFSPNGEYIVTALDDSTVRILDARTGEQIFILDTEYLNVTNAKFSPSGNRVLLIAESTVSVWDAKTGTFTYTIEAEEPEKKNSVFNSKPDIYDAH
ncbi:TIR domain-containing protein, partial [Hellea sp.]|nr:TIR domain-containing protein [Hellea sp.]